MQAKREYRDRDETEVTVLDALVDRHEEGMTVLELRSHADAEIDRLEAALGELKEEGLIDVEQEGVRALAVRVRDPVRDRVVDERHAVVARDLDDAVAHLDDADAVPDRAVGARSAAVRLDHAAATAVGERRAVGLVGWCDDCHRSWMAAHA